MAGAWGEKLACAWVVELAEMMGGTRDASRVELTVEWTDGVMVVGLAVARVFEMATVMVVMSAVKLVALKAVKLVVSSAEPKGMQMDIVWGEISAGAKAAQLAGGLDIALADESVERSVGWMEIVTVASMVYLMVGLWVYQKELLMVAGWVDMRAVLKVATMAGKLVAGMVLMSAEKLGVGMVVSLVAKMAAEMVDVMAGVMVECLVEQTVAAMVDN